MQHITVRPSPKGRFYTSDTLAGKVEIALLADGKPMLGDIMWKEKYRITGGALRGEIRPSNLDMEDNQRAYRTMDIKRMSKTYVEGIHDYEQKRMTRFLIGPYEFRRILKVSSDEIQDQKFMAQKQLEAVIDFQNSHKPILDRKYKGLPIPPFFVYDNEFDGVDYHHAWDWSVWYAEFVVPEIELSGTRGRY